MTRRRTQCPASGEYVQAGAELIGAPQPSADGEIVATAYELAHRLGLERAVVRIGHVGLIWEVLESFNLSERAKLFLANNVSNFADGVDLGSSVEEEASSLGLMPSRGQHNVETQTSAAELLTRLASGSVQLPSATEQTSRTAEDVVGGLRRKLESGESNGDFPKAMELMRELAQLRSGHADPKSGSDGQSCAQGILGHEDVIVRAKDLANKHGLGQLQSFRNLTRVVKAAENAGVNTHDISVDLGLATSIAYYSGTIFEVGTYVGDELVSIGGGGRYDGLAESLGAEEELPALGFALDLDTILDLIDGSASADDSREFIVLLPSDEDAVDAVLQAASDLRADGRSVISLFDSNVDAKRVARSLGQAEVARVNCKDDEGSYDLTFE